VSATPIFQRRKPQGDDRDDSSTNPTALPIGMGNDEDAEPVELPLVGGGTFTAEQTANAVLHKYGTGFGVLLIDGEGRNIVGTATFYIVLRRWHPVRDGGVAGCCRRGRSHSPQTTRSIPRSRGATCGFYTAREEKYLA